MCDKINTKKTFETKLKFEWNVKNKKKVLLLKKFNGSQKYHIFFKSIYFIKKIEILII